VKSQISSEGKYGGKGCKGDGSRIEKFGSWDFVSRPAGFRHFAQEFSQNPPRGCAYCTKETPSHPLVHIAQLDGIFALVFVQYVEVKKIKTFFQKPIDR
jgi:hypothetical protein